MKQLVMIITSCVLAACASAPDAATAAASDDSPRRDDCILESSIRGYSVLDESNLILSASRRRNYHVVLARRAWGLKSSWGIGFDTPTGRICSSFSKVVFEGRHDGESIRIGSIRALSEEEHEELLIQWGKKEPEIKQGPAPQEVDGAEVEELGPDADDSSGN